MAVHVLIASSCPEHFRKPRFMPYNSRHHIFARGALGEKARELEDEFAQMHPYPPDEFLDKLEKVAADMRVQCPLWLEDTLELYNSALAGSDKWKKRGPIYRMTALL